MGMTKISDLNGNYLTYVFRPVKIEYGQPPDTFVVTEGMHKYQSLPVYRDSGGPLLFGKVPNLRVAGVFHGGRGTMIDSNDIYATAQWISLLPHLDWINRTIEVR